MLLLQRCRDQFPLRLHLGPRCHPRRPVIGPIPLRRPVVLAHFVADVLDTAEDRKHFAAGVAALGSELATEALSVVEAPVDDQPGDQREPFRDLEGAAGWYVWDEATIRDKKAANLHGLPAVPVCEMVAFSAENGGVCAPISARDHNLRVEFLTVGRGYEPARHSLSLFVMFEHRVVHTTSTPR